MTIRPKNLIECLQLVYIANNWHLWVTFCRG